MHQPKIGIILDISIHALREESDTMRHPLNPITPNFNPRSP